MKYRSVEVYPGVHAKWRRCLVRMVPAVSYTFVLREAGSVYPSDARKTANVVKRFSSKVYTYTVSLNILLRFEFGQERNETKPEPLLRVRLTNLKFILFTLDS